MRKVCIFTQLLALSLLFAIPALEGCSAQDAKPDCHRGLFAIARDELLQEQQALGLLFPDSRLYQSPFYDVAPIIPPEFADTELTESQQRLFVRVVAIPNNSRTKPLNRDQLSLLPRFKHLKDLGTVEGANDETLLMLSKVKTLESLTLIGDFTPTGYRHLKNLPNLRVLFAGAHVHDDLSLQAICDITSLEQLNIGYCDNLSAEGLRHIGKLKRLKELRVRGVPGREWIEPWASLTDLRILWISVSDDEGFDAMCNISSLEGLIVNPGPKVTSDGLQALGKLRNLLHLEMRNVKAEDLAFLAKLKRLQYLSFSTDDVNVLERLVDVPSLKYVHFICFEAGIEEAAEKLHRERPGLTIEFDGPPGRPRYLKAIKASGDIDDSEDCSKQPSKI